MSQRSSRVLDDDFHVRTRNPDCASIDLSSALAESTNTEAPGTRRVPHAYPAYSNQHLGHFQSVEVQADNLVRNDFATANWNRVQGRHSASG